MVTDTTAEPDFDPSDEQVEAALRDAVRLILRMGRQQGFRQGFIAGQASAHFGVSAQSLQGVGMEPPEDDDPNGPWRVPLSQLALSTRTRNALERDGISSLGHLVGNTLDQIRTVRQLGSKAMGEIVDAVRAFDYEPYQNRFVKTERASRYAVDIPLEEISLDVKTLMVLKRMNVNTVGELMMLLDTTPERLSSKVTPYEFSQARGQLKAMGLILGEV